MGVFAGQPGGHPGFVLADGEMHQGAPFEGEQGLALVSRVATQEACEPFQLVR